MLHYEFIFVTIPFKQLAFDQLAAGAPNNILL